MDVENWEHLSLSTAVNFAKETIRGCILINGGAAAGIVAFIPSAKGAKMDVETLAQAALWFGWGAFLAVLTFGISYIAQIYIAEKGHSDKHNRLFNWLRVAAVAVCVGSGGCFIGGLYVAFEAIRA